MRSANYFKKMKTNPKRKGKRIGAVGLADAAAKCPHPMPASARHLQTNLVKQTTPGQLIECALAEKHLYQPEPGVMTPRKLRAFALRDPAGFRNYIRGARDRELTARHLILHPDKVALASPEELAALREYIAEKGWRSMYNHDRRMYLLLRAGVEKLRNVLRHKVGLKAHFCML